MRKLTASEVNEIADIFKATLEAYISNPRTARTKTAGDAISVEGDEVDPSSVPVGTGFSSDAGTVYKTSRGWVGSAVFGSFSSDDEISSDLADGPTLQYTNGPSTSPKGSVDFEDEDELFEAVVEDERIDFGGYKLYLDGFSMKEGGVIRVNGSSTYFMEEVDRYFTEDGKRLDSPEDFANDIARFGFPLQLEYFPPRVEPTF
jgi:hypothetical protein